MADDLITRSEAQLGEDAENALIAQTLSLSDLSPASVLSIMAKGAWAPEIASLYSAQISTAEGYYVQTAAGAALDRRLADFGLERRGSARTYGPVTFRRIPAVEGGLVATVINIPQGFTVRARDLQGEPIEYTTLAAAVIAANVESVVVEVECAVTGSRGNVGSGAVNELGAPIAQLKSVENTTALTSGRDRDGDEAARQVFFNWLEARTRGTKGALVYAATSYVDPVTGREPIASAQVQEYLDAPGPDNLAARVYVWGHNGQMPSIADIDGVQQRIDGYTDGDGNPVDGWRAAGILVDVTEAQSVSVNVIVQLVLSASGSQVTRDRLQRSLTLLVTSLGVGQPLRVKDVFDQVCALGTEVANAIIIAPGADIDPGLGRVIVPGDVVVV